MSKFDFGRKSMVQYYTLKPPLQKVAYISLSLGLMDFSIICGHRSEVEQTKAFNKGKSRVQWPDGKHNSLPSQAMDCVPYVDGKISWNHFHCCVLAGIILATAKYHDVNLRWGGNFDMDGEPITDQDFQDLCHFELIKKGER